LDEEKLEKMVWSDVHRLVNLKDPSIRILVTGSIGTGKTTLANALAMAVAKTGDYVGKVTKDAEQIEVVKNGIRVVYVDTPGLGHLHRKDEDTLHEVQKQSENVDLFLFCLMMTERLARYDIEDIQNITRTLGEDIWNKGLFILTFANKVEEEHFTALLHQWENLGRKWFKTAIDSGIAERIPIVPAGFRDPQLPDRSSWVREFWDQASRRMSFKGKLYLAMLNRDKIHNTPSEMKLSQDMYGDPGEQPLIACYMSKEERWIDLKHTSAVGQTVGKVLISVLSLPLAGANMDNSSTPIVLDNFGWCVKEEVNCYDEVIVSSLITAFLEENPEYENMGDN